MKTWIVAVGLGISIGVPALADGGTGLDGSQTAKPVYHQGFEKAGAPPVRVWSTNATYEAHQLAVLEDPNAPEGTHALKVDITLKSGSYLYILGPMRVRPDGTLSLTGRFRLGEALPKGVQVRFGVGYDDPAANTKGNVRWTETVKFGTAVGDWTPLKTELGWLSGVSGVAHTQGWALLITGQFNGQRITFSVDDLQAQGGVVTNLEVLLAAWKKKSVDAATGQNPAVPAPAAAAPPR